MALTPKWLTATHPVTDGEQVKGAVANRLPKELDQNTQYLKARIDALTAGSALTIEDVALASDVLVGQAVYYNSTNARYEKALANLDENTDAGYYTSADSSYIVGIVALKTSATVGDIVLYGYVEGIDMTNLVDGTVTPGAYFLSMSSAGKVTQQEPPLAMFVAYILSSSSILVMPQYKDLLESHVHYKFNLSTATSMWLDAGSAVFNNLAPAGAVYGYNMAGHTALESVFPPTPAASACVVRYTSNSDEYYEGVLMSDMGDCPTIVVDMNGIWWMSSVDPTSSTTYISDVVGEGESSSSAGICPTVKYTLYFSKMVFKTDTSVVTSVQPATGSPITVHDSAGLDATQGNVYLDINAEFTEGTATAPFGGIAYKEIDGLLLKLGYVVSGVAAGSSNISITSDYTATDGGVTYNYGKMTIDFVDPDSTRQGPVELIALDNATEVVYEDVMYIGLPASRDSDIRVRVGVPDAVPTNPIMSFEVTAIGRTAGSLPTLGITYRRVLDPGTAAVALPLVEGGPLVPATLTFGAATVLANEYRKATSATFTVAANDIVYATISRSAAAGDGYAGDVGLLRVKYSITSA
jgi:hypothetical protein